MQEDPEFPNKLPGSAQSSADGVQIDPFLFVNFTTSETNPSVVSDSFQTNVCLNGCWPTYLCFYARVVGPWPFHTNENPHGDLWVPQVPANSCRLSKMCTAWNHSSTSLYGVWGVKIFNTFLARFRLVRVWRRELLLFWHCQRDEVVHSLEVKIPARRADFQRWTARGFLPFWDCCLSGVWQLEVFFGPTIFHSIHRLYIGQQAIRKSKIFQRKELKKLQKVSKFEKSFKLSGNHCTSL